GAAVEGGVDRSGDLVAAVGHAGVGEDHDAAGAQRGREIPLAGLLQLPQAARLAESRVLVAVELEDLLLEFVALHPVAPVFTQGGRPRRAALTARRLEAYMAP